MSIPRQNIIILNKCRAFYIIKAMKKIMTLCTITLLIIGLALCASCAPPLSAQESSQESATYERIYASEPQPTGKVKELLDFLDTCVGGQYIYGAQGHKITPDYLASSYAIYENYFSHGRYEYFADIAEACESGGYAFPVSYAWDCSGLWWYAANKLNFYGEPTDMTANGTYHTICTPITKDELRPGDLVFLRDPTGKISHMGIVGSAGYIYEAASGFVGVVKKRTIDNRVYDDIIRGKVIRYPAWNVFGRPKIFE